MNASSSGAATSFFHTAGGDMPPESPAYVVRRADGELFAALAAREFCYVLDSRQMGKSSLRVRVAKQLREHGHAVVSLDLQWIGAQVTIEQWYAGLLAQLVGQLGLDATAAAEFFRRDESNMPLVQRWFHCLRDYVLPRVDRPLTVFVDEIDLVRSLPFSADDFFAGIRACHNARGEESAWRHVAFCLIGLATPSQLIRDPHISPFNIGRRIELDDITLAEARPLTRGFDCEPARAERLLDRILSWTGGHPHLTQRFCAAAVERRMTRPADVDRFVGQTFLNAESPDQAFAWVADGLRKLVDSSPDSAVHSETVEPATTSVDWPTVLNQYLRIRRGGLPYDSANPCNSPLTLSGLCRVRGRRIVVRNRLFQSVFDARWVRDQMPHQELRRQRRAFLRGAAIAALAVATLLLAAAAYWDRYERVIETYYAHVENIHGVRQGIGRQLTRSECRRRSLYYVVSRRGRAGPVTEVRCQNGLGHLTSEIFERFTGPEDLRDAAQIEGSSLGVCRWVYVWINPYSANRRLVSEQQCDRLGQTITSLHYPWQHNTSENPATFIIPFDHLARPRSATRRGAKFLRVTRDQSGFDVRTDYLDEDSQVIEFVTYSYDARGYRAANAWFTSNGEKTLNLQGFHAVKDFFDDQGNDVEWRYLGVDDMPVLSTGGYARVTVKYDECGNSCETAFFGTNDQPVLSSDGLARFTTKYDDRGNLIDRRYFGVRGEATLHKDGNARFTLKYDDQGNPIEFAYFGLDGRPTLTRDGFAISKTKYDNRRFPLETTYFGVNNEPIIQRNGTAGFQVKRDDRGNAIETVQVGVNNEPVVDSDGVARFTIKRDERGNAVETTYFDTRGKPALHKDGNAKYVVKYDDRGYQIETMNLGLDGRPTRTKYGYAKAAMKYDERGNAVETTYFDANGRPTLHNDGNATLVAKYDARGNQIETSYLGLDGELVLNKDGFAKATMKYDERGNILEVAYFDTKGRPTLHKDGNWKLVKAYDDRGNATETSFLGLDGRPALNKEGVAKEVSSFDLRGNLLREAYFGVDGRPVVNQSNVTSFAGKYDERDRRIEWNFYGLDGHAVLASNGFSTVRAKYDDRGNVIEKAFFGKDGELVLHKQGASRQTVKYDEYGNAVETEFFGLDNRPTTINLGWAKVVAEYDIFNNQVAESFFGEDGAPVLNASGSAKVTMKYDDRRNRVESCFLGLDGLLKPNIYGVAKVTSTCDARGNVIETSHYDADERMVRNTYGVARITTEYDARDNPIVSSYCGPDGGLVVNTNGVARVRKKYDLFDRVIESSYYGVEGQLILNKDGCAKVTAKHDNGGNLVGESYFGVQGEPVNAAFGEHRWEKDVDSGETSWWDKDGRRLRSVVRVSEVVEESQAEKLGIAVGDVLVEYDGNPVVAVNEFIELRSREIPDSRPRMLKVRRGQDVVTITVRPGRLGTVITNVRVAVEE